MPVMRYGFGIFNWKIIELKAIDRKVRKILTKGKYHHPKSNIHRLYLSRKEGGRGLIGAFDCHRQECTALATYLYESEDEFAKIVLEIEKPKKYGILSYLDNKPRAGNTKVIDQEHHDELKSMSLHGNYFQEQAENTVVNLSLSRRWLDVPYFRFETESLICAAQEQALATNYVRSKIWKTNCDTKCRLCKKHNETIAHIVSGCTMLAGTQYMYRHNQVAKYVHWNILNDLKIKFLNPG